MYMKKLNLCKDCHKGFFGERKLVFCEECKIERNRQRIVKRDELYAEQKFLCAYCGIAVVLPFGKKKKNRKYCDKHIIHLEGKDYQRELIRRRDNFTCQICKRVWQVGERRFDVHHLDEDKEGWDNVKKNPTGTKQGVYANDKANLHRMITLCHRCHLNLPHIKRKMSEAVRS